MTDPKTLAEKFADFFEEKILKLTSQMPPINVRNREAARMSSFNLTELETSLTFLKTKMSAGPDGIPMQLVKFYTQKKTTDSTVNLQQHPDRWIP